MTEMAGLPMPHRVPEAKPYWDAALNGVLKLQQCAACGQNRFYPRHLCPDCGASAVRWIDASGRGTVYSFTTVYRGPTKAFKDRQPYIIALIDLNEGPRMMTSIVGDDADQIRIGDVVTVRFEARGDMALPVFARAS